MRPLRDARGLKLLPDGLDPLLILRVTFSVRRAMPAHPLVVHQPYAGAPVVLLYGGRRCFHPPPPPPSFGGKGREAGGRGGTDTRIGRRDEGRRRTVVGGWLGYSNRERKNNGGEWAAKYITIRPSKKSWRQKHSS